MRRKKYGSIAKQGSIKWTELMSELSDLAQFWLAIANRSDKVDGKEISQEALTRIHCLENYPNEYWKYATSVFFFTYLDSKGFTRKFDGFLNTLVAYLFSQFVITPTVNVISVRRKMRLRLEFAEDGVKILLED